ncbi:MAG: hypothetical protein IJW53_03955 [Clostridia bacterium]|nr:hypothetical protein [Clostridia bacterium]
MKKRKINPDYLRHITSSDVRNEAIDSLDLALSVKRFAEGYLDGIVSVRVTGQGEGTLSLKLPVVSYLIRLIAECPPEGTVAIEITLGEKFRLDASFDCMPSLDDTVHMINVAKLAGFDVARDGDTLSFTTDAKISHALKIYAVSGNDFTDLLVLTYKM